MDSADQVSDDARASSRSSPALGSDTGASVSGPVRSVDGGDCAFVAAIVLLAVHNLFRNLGDWSLLPWDEGIYANVARNMVVEGYWLVPHVDGFYEGGLQPFLEKPPLVFWLQALSMKAFGTNEFAVRIQSVTFTLLTAILVYAVGREVVDRRAGFLSAVVFLTTPMLFSPHGATQGATDMAVIFFGSATTYLVWRGVREDDTRWLVYASIPAVGAVLSKGFDAGVWAFVLAPLLLLHPWLLLSRDAAKAAGVAVAASAVWPLYVWHRHGREFVDVFFVDQVWQRMLEESVDTTAGALFDFMGTPYIKDFPLVFDPWAYLLPVATVVLLGAYWRTRGRTRARAVAFLAWWVVCTFGFYVRFGNTYWYTYKAYVPAALLVGWFLRDASEGRRSARVGLAVGGGALLLFSPRMEGLSPVTYSSFPVFRWGVPGAGIAGAEFALLTVGSLMLLSYHTQVTAVIRTRFDSTGGRPTAGDRTDPPWIAPGGRTTGRLLRAVVVAVLVVSVAILLVSGPAISGDRTSPQEELAGVIDVETPEGTMVYVTVFDDDNYAPLGFYSDRDLVSGYTGNWASDPDVQYVVTTGQELDEVDDSRYRVVHRFQVGAAGNGGEKVFVEVRPDQKQGQGHLEH